MRPRIEPYAGTGTRRHGKIHRRSLTIFTLLLGSMAATVHAGGKRVLCLGTGRGYDHEALFQLTLTGQSMSMARAALENDGFTIATGETFHAANLNGFDIVFLGLFDPAASLTAAEKAAVTAFVHGGGALIYLGDNDQFRTPNASVGGMFGVTYSTDDSATRALVGLDPAHPIARGPAGVVQAYDGSLNLAGFFGGIEQIGPHARSIMTTTARTVVAAIEPGSITPGSGPVVYVSEASGFMNPPLGTVNLADNLTLLRNIFAFASGMGPFCLNDSDCDDGRFCTGVEHCVGSRCQRGMFPCDGGSGCHETTNTCGPCDADEQCDNGLYCDGGELCIGSVCRHGTRPCDSTQGCDESDRTCGPCENDGQCDDGRFCNGVERCTAMAMCETGAGVCTDTCERCDEVANGCAPCLLDLDADGFIGTGDFGFFAGCFGACYPAGDPCLAANFDGSLDRCVGTGDFAAFSGCFGGGCQECGNCDGPDQGGSALIAGGEPLGAFIELVALQVPSTGDEADALPATTGFLQVGETFFLEIWATRTTPADSGLASVYIDLYFDPELMSVTDLTISDKLLLFPRGELRAQEGKVAAIGGCADLKDESVGMDPAWTRVGVVEMRAEAGGTSSVVSLPSGDTFGVSVVGSFGNLSPASVSYGRLNLSLGGGAGIAPAPQYHNALRQSR